MHASQTLSVNRTSAIATRAASIGAAKARSVLVLSAHEGHIDRRIVAELNALAESGREVTLATVPVQIPAGSLDPRVHVTMAEASDTGTARRRGLLSRLPRPLGQVIRWLWWRWPLHRDRLRLDYFDRLVPHATFNAIHCHDLSTLPAAVALRERLRRALGQRESLADSDTPVPRLIYDAHELFPYQLHDRGFQRYWAKVEQSLIREADAVIVVNEAHAVAMKSLYAMRRVEVLYNSYGLPESQAPSPPTETLMRLGFTPHGFHVLFQGGLTRDRNLLSLVRAFKQLDSSFRLLIVGDGPMREELEQVVARQGLENVVLGGWIDQGDLLAITRQADLGIVPYLDQGLWNHQICTPNKLFEFIEAAIPVCCSRLPEVARIVEEQGIGRAYSMSGSHEIAAAIRDCRQRVERGEFSRDARNAARNHFAWPGQAQRLVTLYDELGC